MSTITDRLKQARSLIPSDEFPIISKILELKEELRSRGGIAAVLKEEKKAHALVASPGEDISIPEYQYAKQLIGLDTQNLGSYKERERALTTLRTDLNLLHHQQYLELKSYGFSDDFQTNVKCCIPGQVIFLFRCEPRLDSGNATGSTSDLSTISGNWYHSPYRVVSHSQHADGFWGCYLVTQHDKPYYKLTSLEKETQARMLGENETYRATREEQERFEQPFQTDGSLAISENCRVVLVKQFFYFRQMIQPTSTRIKECDLDRFLKRADRVSEFNYYKGGRDPYPDVEIPQSVRNDHKAYMPAKITFSKDSTLARFYQEKASQGQLNPGKDDDASVGAKECSEAPLPPMSPTPDNSSDQTIATSTAVAIDPSPDSQHRRLGKATSATQPPDDTSAPSLKLQASGDSASSGGPDPDLLDRKSSDKKAKKSKKRGRRSSGVGGNPPKKSKTSSDDISQNSNGPFGARGGEKEHVVGHTQATFDLEHGLTISGNDTNIQAMHESRSNTSGDGDAT